MLFVSIIFGEGRFEEEINLILERVSRSIGWFIYSARVLRRGQTREGARDSPLRCRRINNSRQPGNNLRRPFLMKAANQLCSSRRNSISSSFSILPSFSIPKLAIPSFVNDPKIDDPSFPSFFTPRTASKF